MNAFNKHFLALPKHLLRISLVGLVLILFIWFALQAFALRDPEQYRPKLIELFHTTTGLNLTIGSIEHAPWRIQPGVLLKHVEVFDESHHSLLTVPSLEARLSLLNLFRGRLDFSRLKIVIDELSIVRDDQGQWYLASLPIPKSDSRKNPFLNWLIQQGRSNLSIHKVVMTDHFTHQPSYVFHQLELSLKNSGSQHHVKGTLVPDTYFGSAMSFDGDIYGAASDDLSTWHGDVKWSTQRFNLTSLLPWFPQLKWLQTGYGALNADLIWLPQLQMGVEADVDLHELKGQLEQTLHGFSVHELIGHVGLRQIQNGYEANTRQLLVKGESSLKISHPLDMNVTLTDGAGSFSVNQLSMDDIHNNIDQIPLSEEQRQFWYKLGLQGNASNLQGSWQGELQSLKNYHFAVDLNRFAANPLQQIPAIHDFTGHMDVAQDGGKVKGQGTSLTLNYPSVFVKPIYLEKYAIDTNWVRDGDHLSITLNDVNLINTDMAGNVTGNLTWTAEGVGQGQIQGQLQRADMSAIWRYMPLTMNPEARNWLKAGLTKGLVKEVNFQVNGNLQQFPFAKDEGGVFRVNAKVYDANVNFNPKWPIIEHVAGDFYIKGAELGFSTNTGTILNNSLKQVSIKIPDYIHSNDILLVDGQAESSVANTLAFIKNSPVSESIHHITDQFSGTGNGVLALKMTIPLNHTIDTTLQGDYRFIDAGLDDGDKGIPPLSGLNGHLYFTETGLSSNELKATVLGGPAELLFTTDSNHVTQLQAKGTADASALFGVYGNPLLKNVSGSSPWTGVFKFTAKQTEIAVDSQVKLVNEPVSVSLATRQDGLIDLALKGNTSLNALNTLFPSPLLSVLDSNVDWNGHVILSQRQDSVSFALAALVLNKPVIMTVRGSMSHLLMADVAGRAEVSALSRLGLKELQNVAQGGFDWKAHFEKRPEQTTLSFSSNLKGVSISGPDLYHKTANQTLPLSLIVQPVDSGNTLMSLNVDSWFGMKVYYQSNSQGSFNATRGVVNLGGPYLGQVGPGFSITGRLEHTNLDDLLSYWDKHKEKWIKGSSHQSSRDNKTLGNGFFGSVNTLDINVSDITWRQRQWRAHRVKANWNDPQWAVDIRGEQVNGSVNWNKTNQGAVKAVFSQLVVPETNKTDTPKSDTKKTHVKAPITSLASINDLRKMPDVDLVADHCQLGKRSFAHLELIAKQKEGSWKINRLIAANDGGEIRGDGQWTIDNETTRSQFKLEIDAKNLGKFVEALGYNKLISRGDGKINADLSWPGSPMDYDFNATSGAMSIDVHDGQFSKVDPGGAGRLIGLLSLQSLPRRITLDFNDFFSQGFAFDAVKGDFSITEGVLKTPAFEMSGPAARVKLTGSINVPDETSNLIVKVNPAVGGDLSMAGTIIGGPVVGAATYLVQKILRDPLGKVLSYEYRISGDWDNPQIDSVDGNSDATNQ